MPGKPPDKRRPTEEELRLWEAVTQDDERLPHAAIEWEKLAAQQEKLFPTALLNTPSVPVDLQKLLQRNSSFTAPKPASIISEVQQGIERRTLRRLQTGRLTIEATLDLHGLGQDAAWNSLIHFLSSCREQGKRYVLVITGKGNRGESTSPGILRSALPHWLLHPPCRGWVSHYQQAHSQHGGEGAFYVCLRRQK